MKNSIWILILFNLNFSFAQETTKISGFISGNGRKIQAANVHLLGTNQKTVSDSLGYYAFENVAIGDGKIQVTSTGFKPVTQRFSIENDQNVTLDFDLEDNDNQLNEVVVSGTLKAVKRLESAVPVEVYSTVFFKKNPTASIYEALQNINGVRPQLNCGVCNTGDIHINGWNANCKQSFDGLRFIGNSEFIGRKNRNCKRPCFVSLRK